MDGSDNIHLRSVTADFETTNAGGLRRISNPGVTADSLTMELIEPRTFERECFEFSAKSFCPDAVVATYKSFDDWKATRPLGDYAQVVLFNIGGRRIRDADVRADLAKVIRLAGQTPVIILAVSEALEDMLDAIDYGAKGYIPASVGVAVMFGAARLAASGGVFLPALAVCGMRDQLKTVADDETTCDGLFTKRQASVADALRRGKANKLIAYELGMCESTVKVHIRTIMKRLKASNRTEAAFKLHEMLNGD